MIKTLETDGGAHPKRAKEVGLNVLTHSGVRGRQPGTNSPEMRYSEASALLDRARVQTSSQRRVRRCASSGMGSATKLSTPVISVPRSEGTEKPVSVSVEPTNRDVDRSFRIYLKDACEVPLLKREEEVVLARKIRRGDKAAREQMIRANLRLVIKIAYEYDGLGLPILDLINEGNIGLMRAVDRFDPRKGAKLSTYAAWWIKQAVKRALANQSKTIRLPVHLVDRVAKMRRMAANLHEEFGRDPTDKELAEAMGMSRARVTELWQASARPTSLDAPIGTDEDSTTLSEIVADDQMPTAYQSLEEKTVHSMLRRFVENLDPRESTILRYRFGLDGGPERTLEEVGVHFRVTRERIRQVQNEALAKLKKLIERRERVCDPSFQIPHFLPA